MKKQRKHYTPEEKVAILRRHFVEGASISDLCDELGLQPTVFFVAVSPASVRRVLSRAGLLRKWSGKPSKKGIGFEQPPQPHSIGIRFRSSGIGSWNPGMD